MNRQSPSADKPSLASRTLDWTTLFTYGLSPLRGAFVSLPITFPSELSQALLTLDLVALVLPLLLVVCYCCVINSLPIRSMDVLAIYAIQLVLWYSQVFQVPMNGIAPSSPRSSLWAKLGKPSKQCHLRDAVVWHSSKMS